MKCTPCRREPARRERPHHRPARCQRRRQDHHTAHAGGTLPARRRRISVDDIDVLQQPCAALARMGILGDAHRFYRASPRARTSPTSGRLGMDEDAANARAESLSQLLDMKAILDRRADGFSQGERMKTAWRAPWCTTRQHRARRAHQRPRRAGHQGLREALRWLRSPEGGGKCIVFSTHHARGGAAVRRGRRHLPRQRAWRAAACPSCSTWRAPRALRTPS